MFFELQVISEKNNHRTRGIGEVSTLPRLTEGEREGGGEALKSPFCNFLNFRDFNIIFRIAPNNS